MPFLLEKTAPQTWNPRAATRTRCLSCYDLNFKSLSLLQSVLWFWSWHEAEWMTTANTAPMTLGVFSVSTNAVGSPASEKKPNQQNQPTKTKLKAKPGGGCGTGKSFSTIACRDTLTHRTSLTREIWFAHLTALSSYRLILFISAQVQCQWFLRQW